MRKSIVVLILAIGAAALTACGPDVATVNLQQEEACRTFIAAKHPGAVDITTTVSSGNWDDLAVDYVAIPGEPDQASIRGSIVCNFMVYGRRMYFVPPDATGDFETDLANAVAARAAAEQFGLDGIATPFDGIGPQSRSLYVTLCVLGLLEEVGRRADRDRLPPYTSFDWRFEGDPDERPFSVGIVRSGPAVRGAMPVDGRCTFVPGAAEMTVLGYQG